MHVARMAALSAGFTLSFTQLAAADTVTITPKMDCTLYSEDGSLANCAGAGLFVGENASGNVRRSLLAFDVQAAVPSGSTITQATLSLALTRTRALGSNVTLHRVLSVWGEGTSVAPGQEGGGIAATSSDATWAFRSFDTSSWTTLGGDFLVTPSAIQPVSPALQRYAWSTSTMTADVQGWLDTPTNNFGWMVIGNESVIQTALRFGSRQAAVDSHPQLSLVFTPPAPTGACCAADGECSVVLDPGGACVGTYQGAATQCTPGLCPRPPGACCLQDAAATCESRTQTECTALSGHFRGEQTSCSPNPCSVELTPFVDALPLPPIAQPVEGVPGGAASYRISFREKQQFLHTQLPATTVWVYDDGRNGTFPGPTIEARKNEHVEVEWVNDLRDTSKPLEADGKPPHRTDHLLPVDHCPHGAHFGGARAVVHLHGAHVDARYDGYPELTILPGETDTYQYPNWQDASTLWYHDHALGITRLNVMLGLAGLYIIRDDEEDALNLPEGEFEVPLVIQDRSFNPDGTFKYPAMWMDHFFGDKMLVNGKVWPYLNVKRGKYRFRVLNGSGSRFLTLALSNGQGFQMIGNDGGLLRSPIDLTQLTLGPAERADLIVDFSAAAPGSEILLTNSAATPFPQGGSDAPLPNVMKFIVEGTPGVNPQIPSKLREIVPFVEQDALFTRNFQLEKGDDACTGRAWLINGLHWDDITERPLLGTSEIWRFVNRSGITHPMHMHLVFFQVLDRQSIELIDGEPVPTGSRIPPLPEEGGWKDTVQVGPFEVVRVMAKFEDFVGKFAYHCHILEHEDQEMMRQYETRTDCGDGARGLPIEECDDGNSVTSDSCPDGPQGSCMPARCGDGFVWNTDGGDEICDDGEETPTCDSDCTEVECGDGQLNVAAGEGCDDGNTIDGDGCSSSCQPDDGCADCDAGVDAGPDGGTKKGSGGDDGGCGCRVPGGNAISNLGGGGERGLLAFGLLALALARARRRRGRR